MAGKLEEKRAEQCGPSVPEAAAAFAGIHEICVHGIDRYFAFSRFVLYTKERRENNLAGVTGCQELPKDWDVEGWTEDFYGKIVLKPRPEFWEARKTPEDTVAVSDRISWPERYAEPVSEEHYFEEGQTVFSEQNGMLRIDAAAALSESENAWTSDGRWQYCAGETYEEAALPCTSGEPEPSGGRKKRPA